jgi:hypothetical protein
MTSTTRVTHLPVRKKRRAETDGRRPDEQAGIPSPVDRPALARPSRTW